MLFFFFSSRHPGRTESALSARCVRKRFCLNKNALRNRSGNQLRNPVAIIYGKRLVPQINKNDFYFAAIVAVDCAGRIKDSNAVFLQQARSADAPEFQNLQEFQNTVR